MYCSQTLSLEIIIQNPNWKFFWKLNTVYLNSEVQVPSVGEEVNFDVGIPRPPVFSWRQVFGAQDSDDELMSHFIVPQLYLQEETYSLRWSVRRAHPRGSRAALQKRHMLGRTFPEQVQHQHTPTKSSGLPLKINSDDRLNSPQKKKQIQNLNYF